MSHEAEHARAVSPLFIPNKGGTRDDFHGLTDIGVDPTVDSEDVFIIGQKAKCATDKDTPEVTLPLTQLERGEIDTYLVLSNKASEPSGGLSLTDFNNSLVDVFYYFRHAERGDVDVTVWSPKCTINNISLDIGDPEARITRSFDLSSDDRRVLFGANNHGIHVKDTAPSGTSGNYNIDLSGASPSADPNNTGQFLLRVDRTRSGTTTTLTLSTDYTFDSGTDTLTIISAESGDVFNIYYSSSSFGTLGDPTTVDSDSDCFLKAENVTVLISDGTTEVELDRLTSLSLNADLNRLDEKVIGNDERILREISDTPVTLDLSGRVKDLNTEKAFMNQLGSTDVISRVADFKDNIKVTIKLYSTKDKTTFLIGYQVDNLSFTDGSFSFTANDFGTSDVSAQSDNLKITTTEGDL